MPASRDSETAWDTVLDTPFGPLRVAGTAQGLTIVGFTEGGEPPRQEPDEQKEAGFLAEAKQQLREYFEGRRQGFTLPVAPGGTAFQQRVWQELQKIPWGTTTTYREIAQRIGQPTAVRAVGSANGRNPVSIVIPCHRVIGSDGSLTGYAGGIATKRRLLQHEGALLM
jgi:methylated-DNA-[protein]-cysteine S-methyltransferase